MECGLSVISIVELNHGLYRKTDADKVRREVFADELARDMIVHPDSLAIAQLAGRIERYLEAKKRLPPVCFGRLSRICTNAAGRIIMPLVPLVLRGPQVCRRAERNAQTTPYATDSERKQDGAIRRQVENGPGRSGRRHRLGDPKPA
jgi:hypothetical protein